MTDTSTGLRMAERIGNGLTTGLGFLLLPLAYLVSPKFVRDCFREGNAVWLSQPEHRDRICYSCVETTASERRLTEVKELLHSLLDDGDWETAFELIAEWDQNREQTEDQVVIAIRALEIIAEYHAEGWYEANVCMPFELPVISPATRALYTALGQENPENFVLAAFCAYLEVIEAWERRGSGYEYTVEEEAWDDALAAIERSEVWLTPFAGREEGSLLAAYLRLRWMPFTCTSRSELRRACTDLSDLAPQSREPVFWWSILNLPRWFGTAADFDQCMREAAFRHHQTTGMAAYARAYIFATCTDPGMIALMDFEMFREGVHDLIQLMGKDPARVSGIAQNLDELSYTMTIPGASGADRKAIDTLRVKLRHLSQEVLRQHLTALHIPSWGSEEKGLDWISKVFMDELDQGANLIMDDQGIRTVAEDPRTHGDAPSA